MNEITLQIVGMQCGHCKARVESTLTELEGVQSAQVDLEAGQARVTFDAERVDAAAMIAAIDDAGFEAKA